MTEILSGDLSEQQGGDFKNFPEKKTPELRAWEAKCENAKAKFIEVSQLSASLAL